MNWTLLNQPLSSRLFIGSALYPNPEIMQQAILASQASVVTVSLRRQAAGDNAGQSFWTLIQSLNKHILPNTAGCHTAKEAINTAMMAREVFQTNWIKLETIGNDYTLEPNPQALIEATKTLIAEGFKVFPYTTDDLTLAHQLADAGCEIIMPWGAQIGSGQGLMNPKNLSAIRQAFPELTLVIDAGIGKPSHASAAMELGFDAVLLNSAIALSPNPVQMAQAFKLAIEAGRKAYEAGSMPQRNFASPSTPVVGTPFWHDNP